MKEKLISYQTAQIAKEMGFDWKHADFYIDQATNGDYINLPCVPQSLLQKWLREVYEIQMMINPFYDSLRNPKCSFACDVIEIARTGHVIKSQRHNTYEDALEEGLQNGMKLIEVKETGDIMKAHKNEII